MKIINIILAIGISLAAVGCKKSEYDTRPPPIFREGQIVYSNLDGRKIMITMRTYNNTDNIYYGKFENDPASKSHKFKEFELTTVTK